jgi:diguanylate cyclase (GGDEF)-like protein/putative nucleotidyltransferase with HDIG domain
MAVGHLKNLTGLARTYVAIIVLAGAATVLISLGDLSQGRIDSHWLWLALLTLASGSATVHLASIPVAISISETFVFTSALLFGASAGTLTVALDAAVISFWSYRRGQAWFKIAFNVCALPLTMWVASHLFFLLSNVQPLFRSTEVIESSDLVAPLVVFTLAYFSLSSWIVTFAISLEKGGRPFKIWRDNFLWISLNYFGGAFVALLLVSYSRELDFSFLVIVVPLLAILYATYAATVGRFEDANRHLTELNSLYMATIETLAMAIDAKDQVTHGHIRRVQTYAVGLAHELGVADQALIRAIEAAALLHDMGKLAVPEYILNKPGPLTPAEFDKMKLHASVGADILSSIRFPYPVVPIVRHHHENWDGTGYPDGIKGTDIPIGARILSVVDCFDALTSDRPYRPRLSDQDATKILLERRGTMYDPMIVDKFLSVYRELAPSDPDAAPTEGHGLSAITRVALPVDDHPLQPTALDDIAASTEEMLVLYDLARSLAGQLQIGDAADVITNHLRRIIPASTFVFFVYEAGRDELVAAHASGEGASLFAGLRIPRGQRLTGWVAANRRTILNSDPVLDLGDVSRSLHPRLRSCLSTPLQERGQLVGVLSLYSPQQVAFSDDHKRVVEVIGRQVSKVIKQSLESQRLKSALERDSVTGLPHRDALATVVSAELESATAADSLSIILIQANQGSVGAKPAGQVATSSLDRVIAEIRGSLRAADVLFRYGDDEFVALLAQTEQKSAYLVAARMCTAIAKLSIEERAGVLTGVASAPPDGGSLEALVQTARSRLRRIGNSSVANSSIH